MHIHSKFIVKEIFMREKLATLPLTELKEIAKTKGLKGISTIRKSALIDRLMEIYEEEQKAESAPESVQEKVIQAAAIILIIILLQIRIPTLRTAARIQTITITIITETIPTATTPIPLPIRTDMEPII